MARVLVQHRACLLKLEKKTMSKLINRLRQKLRHVYLKQLRAEARHRTKKAEKLHAKIIKLELKIRQHNEH